MMSDAAAVLRKIPLFSEVLDEQQIERLGSRCHFAVFRRGSMLIAEGDFGTSMFAIVEGSVSVLLADKRGTAHDVAILKGGDIVGEMSLLTGARRNANVVAEDEVLALEITKVALEEILARAPDLIERFGTVLARRQAQLDRVASEVANANKDDLIHQIRRFFGGK
jgi:CRP/FNR family cyclic AMP-dependent transcriptional regulator